MKYPKSVIAEQRTRLLEWIKPGDTVYTILENVSRSGMQRTIRVILPKIVTHSMFPADCTVEFFHPNYAVSVVLGRSQAKRKDGIICNGAGMDMGFDLVYQLGHVLFGDGYKLNHRWM